MKKVALILLLFCSTTVSAQGLNYGLSGGYLSYDFGEHGINYNHSAVSLGVCTQYVFKDSLFGIEGNLLLYTNPPVYGSSTCALAPYFFFNVAPRHHVSLELKLGLLAYQNLGNYAPQPANDIGPSFGLYLYFVFRHTPQMGLDLTFFLGQRSYVLQETNSPGATLNPDFSSQVVTINLSFKLLVP